MAVRAGLDEQHQLFHHLLVVLLRLSFALFHFDFDPVSVFRVIKGLDCDSCRDCLLVVTSIAVQELHFFNWLGF